MRSVLRQLNKTQGVRGAMIVNKDGIIVASEFGIEIDETGIGAVASSILAAVEGAVKRINLGKLQRFIITGSENKCAIVDAGPALLIVVMQREANFGLVNAEIKVAIKDVVEKAKM